MSAMMGEDAPGRAKRTLKDLLLALINATLVLVILAALAVGWAIYAVMDVTETAATRTASAVVSASGIKPAEWQAELRRLNDELTALRRSANTNPELNAKLTRISNQLGSIEQSLRTLSEPEKLIEGDVVDRALLMLQQRLHQFRQQVRGDTPAPGTPQSEALGVSAD
ncbi:hypothetical protein [Pseudovibrio sp. SPO723]|uniref:hypothetical protein n=1 Tax=Nesiotobacter zosterae TaxID=392721 RepID=UPI0029C3BDBA|nr:hypothetical protein [Pseudovibrio sp. SPO723]MDX5595013.1 hypothetical protein [Pseudovibrio sp. SPO723]